MGGQQLRRRRSLHTRVRLRAGVFPHPHDLMTGRLRSHHGLQDYLKNEDSLGPASPDFLAGQPTMADPLANDGYTVGAALVVSHLRLASMAAS
jgi:hypothetical protein